MRYEKTNKHPGKARIYALKTLNILKSRGYAVQSELSTLTYDTVSDAVKSLSGFFRVYSILLLLVLAVILASSFI